jgi:hypothetical protein
MARVFSSTVQTTVVTPNNVTLTARQVTVGVAALQLPSIVIPDGTTLVVKSYSGNANNRRIWISDSAVNVLLPASRNELRPGESVGLSVQNANAIYVAASAAGTILELLAEQDV